jgi:hypothetical protein
MKSKESSFICLRVTSLAAIYGYAFFPLLPWPIREIRAIRGLSWDRLWPIALVRSVDRLRGQVYCFLVTAIAEKLDRKLSDWKPETASEVEKLVAEIINWADADALDLMRPRHLEQEVLDILDAD